MIKNRCMWYGSFPPNHFPTICREANEHVGFLIGVPFIPFYLFCSLSLSLMVKFAKRIIIRFKHIKLYNSVDYSRLTYQHTNIHRLHRFSRATIFVRAHGRTLLSSTHRRNSKTCNFHILSSSSSLCQKWTHEKFQKTTTLSAVWL